MLNCASRFTSSYARLRTRLDLETRLCAWATLLNSHRYGEPIPDHQKEPLMKQIDYYERITRNVFPKDPMVREQVFELNSMGELLAKHLFEQQFTEEDRNYVSRLVEKYHEQHMRPYSENICQSISFLQKQVPRLRKKKIPTKEEVELSELILSLTQELRL